jgi:hypothetical protein
MGEKRNVYRLLGGMPEGKRPLRRPVLRWVDNIKMDLEETGVTFQKTPFFMSEFIRFLSGSPS